jgi:DNA-binding CsgD family transcriptional regulator
LAAAAAVNEEAEAVTIATGTQPALFAPLALAAWQGRELQAAELIETSTRGAVYLGEGVGLAAVQSATALLYNGLGRYQDALEAGRRAGEHPEGLPFVALGLVELIEAATRTGKTEGAADALRRLSETTRAGGTDWALGIEARSRALLSDSEAAEQLYREAIDRLGRTRVRVELARAHLLYGEWLRRERRRADAREQLHTAYEMFVTMGADGFAERAERELQATGETARKRTVETRADLTAQEAQIARLARDGLSNAEIGGRLFTSPRTVQYHLGKVFTKLGINSRMQLDRVLPGDPNVA